MGQVNMPLDFVSSLSGEEKAVFVAVMLIALLLITGGVFSLLLSINFSFFCATLLGAHLVVTGLTAYHQRMNSAWYVYGPIAAGLALIAAQLLTIGAALTLGYGSLFGFIITMMLTLPVVYLLAIQQSSKGVTSLLNSHLIRRVFGAVCMITQVFSIPSFIHLSYTFGVLPTLFVVAAAVSVFVGGVYLLFSSPASVVMSVSDNRGSIRSREFGGDNAELNQASLVSDLDAEPSPSSLNLN